MLQVKIAGQNGFDVTLVTGLFHRVVQFNNPTELIAITIRRIGQYELRVVLSGHVGNLPLGCVYVCAPEHNFPVRPAIQQKFDISHIGVCFGVIFPAKATRCTELPKWHM
jgi:hypothetical protein